VNLEALLRNCFVFTKRGTLSLNFGIVHFLIFWSTLLLLATNSPLWAADQSKYQIKKILTEMGYEDVHIEGCNLEFARTVIPTEKNNGFYRYKRKVSINSLDVEDSFELRYSERGGGFYQLSFSVQEHYLTDTIKADEFGNWVKLHYPNSTWPYLHPEDHDEMTPFLEEEFNVQVPDLTNLNLWIYYSKFGKSTRISPSFQLTYSSRAPLFNFAKAIISYKALGECFVPTDFQEG
jgi:hypothetical protein